MTNERSAKITIGDLDYELILTTKATKEIAKRYGGLEDLGEKLMKAENFEMALDEIVWLITLLANQSIYIHNRLNEEKKELLTEDDVELLTSPVEKIGRASCREGVGLAVVGCLVEEKGSGRRGDRKTRG